MREKENGRDDFPGNWTSYHMECVLISDQVVRIIMCGLGIIR